MSTPDPHSHFDGTLDVTENGRRLSASGPLPIDSYAKSVRVFAVVTQAPPGGPPPAGKDPDAVTCHGEAHMTAGELRAATTPIWQFSETTVNNGVFHEGWARGSALAITIRTDGDIETYSWSEWVWLRRP